MLPQSSGIFFDQESPGEEPEAHPNSEKSSFLAPELRAENLDSPRTRAADKGGAKEEQECGIGKRAK